MCSSRSLWGTVCNRQWTEANSRVVCRNLGYSDEKGIVTPHSISFVVFSLCSYLGNRGVFAGGRLECLQGKADTTISCTSAFPV